MDPRKLLLEVAAKSLCHNRKVGAVIISKDNHVLGTGYNHNKNGGPCEDVAGATEADVVHAEIAAINDWLKQP